MDVAVYARLSKKRKRSERNKRARSGLSKSVEVQMAQAKAFADDKMWPVVGVFKDDDRSASKYSTKPRKEYPLLIEAIKRGEVEAIICTEMTRLYRRLEELLALIKLAETTRLRGIWTTDDVSYDLSTPEGIHQAIGAVNNAMLESAKTSVRVRIAKKDMAKEGMPSGGGRPYGYEEGGMILRQSEVAVLLECKDRYLAGATIRDLVRDLNRRELFTAGGKAWRIENLQRTLLKKRYAGILEHNGIEYPALWPAIFTLDEWQRMDAIRLSRAWKGPNHNSGYRTYLLTGFVYCGQCGAQMYGSRKQISRGVYQRRYRCPMYDNYGLKSSCGRTYRAADPLEAWITEAVFYRFDTPEVSAALVQTDETDNTDELIKAYRDAKTNLEQMVADYASGFLNRSDFAIAKNVAETNLQQARDDLSKIQHRRSPGIPVGIESLRESWQTAGLDFKREVIRLLVDRVVIRPGHPGSHEWHGWRFDPQSISVSWVV